MDLAILRALNGTVSDPNVQALAVFFSSAWVPVVFLGPLAAWLLWKRRYAVVLTVLFISGATDLVTSRVLKPTFDRVRPCRVIEGVVSPDGCGPGESFPSGHAANAFAITSALLVLVPKAGLGMVPIAILVALSRVFLGVHYPSDIMAGAIFGALFAFAPALFIRRRLMPRLAPDQKTQSASL